MYFFRYNIIFTLLHFYTACRVIVLLLLLSYARLGRFYSILSIIIIYIYIYKYILDTGTTKIPAFLSSVHYNKRQRHNVHSHTWGISIIYFSPFCRGTVVPLNVCLTSVRDRFNVFTYFQRKPRRPHYIS